MLFVDGGQILTPSRNWLREPLQNSTDLEFLFVVKYSKIIIINCSLQVMLLG